MAHPRLVTQILLMQALRGVHALEGDRSRGREGVQVARDRDPIRDHRRLEREGMMRLMDGALAEGLSLIKSMMSNPTSPTDFPFFSCWCKDIVNRSEMVMPSRLVSSYQVTSGRVLPVQCLQQRARPLRRRTILRKVPIPAGRRTQNTHEAHP